jgi:hypothetical protein
LNNSKKNPEMSRFQRGLRSRRFGLFETKFRFQKVSFYFKKYLIFFHCFFGIWQKHLQWQWQQLSVLALLLRSAHSRLWVILFVPSSRRLKIPGKDAGVDANYVKEKEGTFDFQILYPINLFDVGAKFAPLFIKVVQYRRGKIEPAFIFNNEYFTKALRDLVDNQKVNGVYPDLGLPYPNAAIQEIDVVDTRAKKFDADDTQECRHVKFLTTHLTTFVKCDSSSDDTLDRIKGFAEWMKIQLSESAEDDGKAYYPFENLFEHGATLGVLKWWGENEKKLTRSMGYTV